MLPARVSLTVPGPVQELCATLHRAGYQAYIVGGAVRDAILGRDVQDWDVTTDCLPDEVATLFSKVIATGAKYGTVTVIIQGLAIEVTTMRQDGTYRDHRRPEEVIFSRDIRQDLARRDFTINAIAYSPLTREVIDPYKGIRDLRRKRLRTVGDPHRRFAEDGLRIMRLFRFASTLGFAPTRATLKAVQAPLLQPISRERIAAELAKLLLGSNLRSTLRSMYRYGVLEEIIPELLEGEGIGQGAMHRYDVLGHNLETAACIEPKLHLRLAALLHDVAKPRCMSTDAKGIHFYGHDVEGAALAGEILRRLRSDNKTINKVTHLIRWHMFNLHGFSSDRAIRRLISKVGQDNIHDLLLLRKADIAASATDMHQGLQAWLQLRNRVEEALAMQSAFGLRDLAIDGRDVMQLVGIRPGPQVGRILEQLLNAVLAEPSLNNREDLSRLALGLAQQAESAESVK